MRDLISETYRLIGKNNVEISEKEIELLMEQMDKNHKGMVSE